jgi:hypothetical protein
MTGSSRGLPAVELQHQHINWLLPVCVCCTLDQQPRVHKGYIMCLVSVAQYALDDRSATVQLGTTTAMAAITADLTTPYNDRAREGSIK